MRGEVKIKTARLVIKKPADKDKHALVEQINDWEVVKWLADVPHPYTLADAAEWLDLTRKEELRLNIFLEDKLIGGVALEKKDDTDYELAYWLGRKYWGQGFATEAAGNLLAYGVKNLPQAKITAGYMIGNESSKNVLKKLGFKEIGRDEKYIAVHKAKIPCIEMLFAPDDI